MWTNGCFALYTFLEFIRIISDSEQECGLDVIFVRFVGCSTTRFRPATATSASFVP